MDPATIISLAFEAINAGIKLVAEVKTSGGMTTDQIIAHAQQQFPQNDQLYATLKASLT